MAQRVDAPKGTVEMGVYIRGGPPACASSHHWQIEGVNDRTVLETLRRADPLIRDGLSWIVDAWSHGPFPRDELFASVELRIEGPAGVLTTREWNFAEVSDKTIDKVAREALRFLQTKLPEHEEIWGDSRRYWEAMRRQREARRRKRMARATPAEAIREIAGTDFGDDWFSSSDIRAAFRKVRGSIRLGTVTSHLNRLHRAGVLERGGNRRRWTYRVASGPIGPLLGRKSKRWENGA